MRARLVAARRQCVFMAILLLVLLVVVTGYKAMTPAKEDGETSSSQPANSLSHSPRHQDENHSGRRADSGKTQSSRHRGRLRQLWTLHRLPSARFYADHQGWLCQDFWSRWRWGSCIRKTSTTHAGSGRARDYIQMRERDWMPRGLDDRHVSTRLQDLCRTIATFGCRMQGKLRRTFLSIVCRTV